MVAALLVIVLMVVTTRSDADAVGTLGLLAAGAFRLMPSLQRFLSGGNAAFLGPAHGHGAGGRHGGGAGPRLVLASVGPGGAPRLPVRAALRGRELRLSGDRRAGCRPPRPRHPPGGVGRAGGPLGGGQDHAGRPRPRAAAADDGAAAGRRRAAGGRADRRLAGGRGLRAAGRLPLRRQRAAQHRHRPGRRGDRPGPGGAGHRAGPVRAGAGRAARRARHLHGRARRSAVGGTAATAGHRPGVVRVAPGPGPRRGHVVARRDHRGRLHRDGRVAPGPISPWWSSPTG